MPGDLSQSLRALLPEICLVALILVLLVLAMVRRAGNSRFLGWFTAVALTVVAAVAVLFRILE